MELKSKEIASIKGQIETARKELKNIRQHQMKLQSDMKNCAKNMETALSSVTSKSNSGLKLPGQDNYSKNFVDEETFNCLLKPVGVIRSAFATKNGTPRQSSLTQHVQATLILNTDVFNNPDHALDQLEEFSHIWLISLFHANNLKDSHTPAKVKPPRLDGMKVGVFATRSPHRPNPLALSLVKLEKVEGRTLTLGGVDLIDGTPVLDIKPYIPNYDSPITPCKEFESFSGGRDDLLDKTVKVASWIQAPPRRELQVLFTPRAEAGLALFHPLCGQNCYYCLDHLPGSAEARQAVCELLKVDPRSTYRKSRCPDRLYYFKVDSLHVTCWFDEENIAEVLRVNSNKTQTF